MKSKTEMVNIQGDASYKNLNKVPIKMWRKWSDKARWVFNDMYSSLNDNAELWLPLSLRKSKRITPAELKVIAWNAAWLAAEAAND